MSLIGPCEGEVDRGERRDENERESIEEREKRKKIEDESFSICKERSDMQLERQEG